jgi:hypothetical protein
MTRVVGEKCYILFLSLGSDVRLWEEEIKNYFESRNANSSDEPAFASDLIIAPSYS